MQRNSLLAANSGQVGQIARSIERPTDVANRKPRSVVMNSASVFLLGSIGLTFLFCCVALREVIFSFEHNAASDIFGEGLLIIGWVAMWRPLEIFLYEWVPIRRRCQILGTLATIPVTVLSK